MTAYDKLTDRELIRLLFKEEDRLPMDFAKEVVSRGKRMVPALAEILSRRENWKRRDSGWCSTTHAYFLLGAIGGEAAVEPLTDAMFAAAETSNDWVCEELPSILGSLGPCAFEALRKIASCDLWDWYIRDRAMAGLAAAAVRRPECEREVFSFIAEIAGDPEDDPETRSWAAHILLDCGRREHEALILSLVDSGISEGHFDADDVRDAWAKGQDLHWYLHDWLEFYSDEQIETRRERWEREELETASDDEYEDGDARERETSLSRKGIMKALGPEAELARKIELLFEGQTAEEEENNQENLRHQYGLAMELHQAIRRRQRKKGTLFQRLKDRFTNPAVFARKEEADEADAFDLFDLAVGRGELRPWLSDLPTLLADEGLPQEGAALAKAWAEIMQEESFLGDRAVILAEAGREDEAREQVQENLRQFPEEFWVRMEAADAFRALKDLAAAEALYRECLKMDVGEHDRREARDRLIEVLRETGKGAEADVMENEDRMREDEARARWEPQTRRGPKIGRNDPCPCGSGKKYKKCCIGKEVAGGTA